MPVFERNQTAILFIHIPKAAGTTIEEAFIDAGYAMSYRRGGRYGPLTPFDRQNGCSPQHLHADLLERHFGSAQFALCFTVVRHPLRRFVSEYRFRVDSGHPFVAGKTLDDFAGAALDQYPKTPMFLDNHIRPQTDFIWRGCEVLRLEDGLEPVSDLVRARTGDAVDFTASPRMQSKGQAAPALSPATEDALRAFYKDDFQSFGYE